MKGGDRGDIGKRKTFVQNVQKTNTQPTKKKMYQEDLKMKKVLALALGILLIPFTAFGMQTMSEADMDSVTGQSGVAISIDNIQIFTASTDELWFETQVGETAAAVGLVYGDESADYLFLNKIAAPVLLGGADGGDYEGTQTGTILDAEGNPAAEGVNPNYMLRGDYSGMNDLDLNGRGARADASVLSIRVAPTNATNGVFSGILGVTEDETDGAYIEIGLPTLEIYSASGSVDELKIYVLGDHAYEGDNPVGSGDHVYSLGTVWTSGAGTTTAILGGRIGITSLGQVPAENTSSSYGDEMDEME